MQEDQENVENYEKESSAPLDVESSLSREYASIARDAESLTKKWWEASRPRRRGAVPPAPLGTKLCFSQLFQKWLEARGLENTLTREANQKGFKVFRFTRTVLTSEQESWDLAFHGTRWYALWLILNSGVMLQSDDRDVGHDFWEPGVYCTPVLDTARWYGRPHILFDDGIYHRCIIELRVDPARRKRHRDKGGVQWVFPEDAVVIRAVWVQTNAPPAVGDQRFETWDPTLEAIPLGENTVDAILHRAHECQTDEEQSDEEFQLSEFSADESCNEEEGLENGNDAEESTCEEIGEEVDENEINQNQHLIRMKRRYSRKILMPTCKAVPMRGSVTRPRNNMHEDCSREETPVESVTEDEGKAVPMRGSVARPKQTNIEDGSIGGALVESVTEDEGKAVPMRGSVARPIKDTMKEGSGGVGEETLVELVSEDEGKAVPMRVMRSCPKALPRRSKQNIEDGGGEETRLEQVTEVQGKGVDMHDSVSHLAQEHIEDASSEDAPVESSCTRPRLDEDERCHDSSWPKPTSMESEMWHLAGKTEPLGKQHGSWNKKGWATSKGNRSGRHVAEKCVLSHGASWSKGRPGCNVPHIVRPPKKQWVAIPCMREENRNGESDNTKKLSSVDSVSGQDATINSTVSLSNEGLSGGNDNVGDTFAMCKSSSVPMLLHVSTVDDLLKESENKKKRLAEKELERSWNKKHWVSTGASWVNGQTDFTVPHSLRLPEQQRVAVAGIRQDDGNDAKEDAQKRPSEIIGSGQDTTTTLNSRVSPSNEGFSGEEINVAGTLVACRSSSAPAHDPIVDDLLKEIENKKKRLADKELGLQGTKAKLPEESGLLQENNENIPDKVASSLDADFAQFLSEIV